MKTADRKKTEPVQYYVPGRPDRKRDRLPVIATDLDGIIGDTDTVLRNALEKYFGIKINRPDVTDYYYENAIPVSKKRFEDFWKWFVTKPFWEQVRLLPHARNSLKKISKKFRIFIFTSRPTFLAERTKKWLIKKRLSFIDRAYHIDVFGKTKICALKKACVRPVFYIEDRLDFARQVARLHSVLLFDYPWNRTKKKSRRLKRISGWKEALKLIYPELK